jgi:hypothetical protein
MIIKLDIQMNTLQITPDTIVADLLNNYPLLEDKLIEIAPVFKKLKNPVLRRTIAKVTSLKQAAIVGNVQLGVLINELRKAAGHETMSVQEASPVQYNTAAKLSWADEKNASVIYDAREDLESGAHPLAKVMKEVTELKDDEVYLLITPFTPAPLIEKLEAKGFIIYSEVLSPGRFGTFVKRQS